MRTAPLPRRATLPIIDGLELPPPEMLPEFSFDLPALCYPSVLNAATALLAPAIELGLGDKTCVIDSIGQWSYRELDAEAATLAAYLQSNGVSFGERVLLRGPNSRMLVAAWMAVLRLGAIAVTTVPALSSAELIPIIEAAGITTAICEMSHAEALTAAQSRARHPHRLFLYRGTELLDHGWRNACLSSDPAETRAEDVAIIAFTSGSTGEPKGCVHLHRDILAISDTFSAEILRPTTADIFCGTPPLGFTFGLGGLLIFPLRAQATAVLVEQSGAKPLAEAIHRYRPTICFSAPTGYRALARLSAQYDLTSLRKAVSAGEYLPPATREDFRRITGIKLIDGIGSTEMLHIFISADEANARPGATGKPVPGYRATILDDLGREMPDNVIGHLAVKGPTGCRYLSRDHQQRYVRHGWNVTGDRYLRDSEGYYRFIGRDDDMIVSAGHKIAPAEIEAALLTHPAVAECAVVGSPDADRNDLVKAWIVPRHDFSGEDDLAVLLTVYLRSQLAAFKLPRIFAFSNALPRTKTGKLQRYLLR